MHYFKIINTLKNDLIILKQIVYETQKFQLAKQFLSYGSLGLLKFECHI